MEGSVGGGGGGGGVGLGGRVEGGWGGRTGWRVGGVGGGCGEGGRWGLGAVRWELGGRWEVRWEGVGREFGGGCGSVGVGGRGREWWEVWGEGWGWGRAQRCRGAARRVCDTTGSVCGALRFAIFVLLKQTLNPKPFRPETLSPPKQEQAKGCHSPLAAATRALNPKP